MGIRDYFNNRMNEWLQRQGYYKASDITPIKPTARILTGEVSDYSIQSFMSDSDKTFQTLAITNYAVYRNIMLIGRMVSEAKLRIQEVNKEVETGWSTVDSHPYTNIMEMKPNPIMSQSFIWLYQIGWLLLKGEAYWLIVSNDIGELKQVYPLPANLVSPIPNPNKDSDLPILGYSYTPSQSQKTEFIAPQYICYHRLPNLFEYWRGLSPLSAYTYGLQINQEAQKTDLEDYVNRLRLQHLLSLPAGTDDYEFSVAQADLRDSEYQGNRWRLIRAGDIKATAINRPRDQYSDLIYQLTEHQANSIFGVPDGIWSKDANRASAQEHRATLIENTVWPLLTMLAEDLTVNMVEPFYGSNTRVIFEDIRPRNIELDIKQKNSRREVQTFNEARAEENLEEYPDPILGNAPYIAIKRLAELRYEPELVKDIITIDQSNNSIDDNKTDDQLGTPNYSDKAINATIKHFELTDLRRWKAIALRLVKQGKNPAEYNFISDYIPSWKYDIIRQQLTGVISSAQVKAIFEDDGEPYRVANEYKTSIQNTLQPYIDNKSNTSNDRQKAKEALLALIPLALDNSFRQGLGVGIDYKYTDTQNSYYQNALEVSLASVDKLVDDTMAGKFSSMDDNEPEYDINSRLDNWAGTALLLYTVGRLFKRSEDNLIWVVGPTDHCSDCARLNGQVHSGSDWLNSGWWPQNRNLECGGYKCLCLLLPTDEETIGGF